MTTSLNSRYVDNAVSWWWWLKNEAKMSNNIVALTDYLNKCSTSRSEVYAKKSAIGNYFMQEFSCDSPDGGFTNITNGDGKMTEPVSRYMSFFFELLGGVEAKQYLNDVIEARYELVQGKAKRIYMTPQLASELRESGSINGEAVFSYGYVRSSNRPANFSYTVM